jgi:hypothetical protein
VNTTIKSPSLTNKVVFYSSNGYLTDPITQTVGTDANGNVQLTATVTTTPLSSETIYAIYSGDQNFSESNSPSIAFQVTIPDFSISGSPVILITAGQAGTAALNVTPLSNLSSTVMLACMGNLPAGSACSFTPASVSLANGAAATDMLSISSVGPSPAAAAVVRTQRKSLVGFVKDGRRSPWWPLGAAAGLAALALLCVPIHRPRRRLTLATALSAGLFCVVSLALGCGGGGGGEPVGPTRQLATTTTTISSTTPKSPSGVPATFTTTVTSSGNPTGTVTFFANGGQINGPIALVNGSVQTQMSFPVGTTAITAQYSGDANNLPSTSAAFNQVITGSTFFTVNAQTGSNLHQINVTATIQ